MARGNRAARERATAAARRGRAVLRREAGDAMLVDEFLPAYDATVVRHAVVDADPETTYEAVLAADLTDTGPVVAALGELRNLPARVRALLGRGEALPPVGGATMDDLRETVIELGARPGEEVVYGMVGKFWQPAIEWADVSADEFAAFEEPGYAKLAMTFSVRPYGADRTLLSYEARTAATDADAHRRFRRYWRVMRPFAGYVMARALDRIAADAGAAGAGPSPGR